MTTYAHYPVPKLSDRVDDVPITKILFLQVHWQKQSANQNLHGEVDANQ